MIIPCAPRHETILPASAVLKPTNYLYHCPGGESDHEDAEAASHQGRAELKTCIEVDHQFKTL